MGYFLICSVCLVVLIVSAVYVCTKMVHGTSFADMFRRIGCSVQSCFNASYSQYARHKNRECSFPNLGLAARPYAYILEKELQLCKRCVLWQSYPINQDIQFLSFKLLGLTKVYEVTDLIDLLTIELQQVYIENAYGTCQDNKEYFQKAGKWANTTKSETTQPGTFEEWGTMPSEERTSTRAEHKIILALLENGYQDAEILRMYPESILYLDKVQRARQTLLEDRAKSNWRDLEVTYIYGKTNTGKTRSVMEQYGYENVYRITDYAHPWDSYKMQDVVLFEEFRSSLRIQDMLSYLDGYPCTLPARYTNKQAGFTKVFITTNIPLEKQYPEVQEKEPETWAAFKRRIHQVQVFYGDDVVDTFESVSEYLTFRSRKAAKKPSHSKLPSLALPSVDSSIPDNDFQNLMPSNEGGEKDD